MRRMFELCVTAQGATAEALKNDFAKQLRHVAAMVERGAVDLSVADEPTAIPMVDRYPMPETVQ